MSDWVEKNQAFLKESIRIQAYANLEIINGKIKYLTNFEDFVGKRIKYLIEESKHRTSSESGQWNYNHSLSWRVTFTILVTE